MLFMILVGTVLVVSVLWIYMNLNGKNRYWKTEGIPYVEHLPIGGNPFKLLAPFKYGSADRNFYNEVYRSFVDERYVGVTEVSRTCLVLRDPNLIGKVLTTDFDKFPNQFTFDYGNSDIDSGLYRLRDDEWRAVRKAIAPAFATESLRSYYPEIVKCSDRLLSILCERHGENIDLIDSLIDYTSDVISIVALGRDAEETNGKLTRMAREIYTASPARLLKALVMILLPRLSIWLRLSFVPNRLSQFFIDTLKSIMKYRQENSVHKNDFIQALVELKDKGCLKIPSKLEEDDSFLSDSLTPISSNIEMTDKLLISQAFTFLTAGFQGANLTLVTTLIELALNPDLQERTRKDIQRVVNKHGGLTFDALREATLLNNCLQESQRKYPMCSVITRECNSKYELSEGHFIRPGTVIVIPVEALHTDPNHWPEPDEYDPDRFTRSTQVNQYTYLPYGGGPRICIGMRFAQIQIKLGIAALLKKYRVELNSKINRHICRTAIEKLINSPDITSSDRLLFDLTKIED